MGRPVNDLLTLARSAEINQDMRDNDYKKLDLGKSVIELDGLLLQVYRQYNQISEHENGNTIPKGPLPMLKSITPVKVFGNCTKNSTRTRGQY